MEFVNQSGAKNDPSDIDKLYKDGLELYWGGFYKEALVKFEQLQRLNSNHSEIKKLIMDSEQNSANSKIFWSKYKTAFIIYDAAAGVIIVLILFAFVLKGKKDKVVAAPAEGSKVQQINNSENSTTATLESHEEKS